MKNNKLDLLFEQWKEHYTSNGIDAKTFTADGIVDEKKYMECDSRVLFVLRESNKFGSGDIRDLLRKGPHYQMWHTLARWAAGIHHSFPSYESVDKYEVMSEALSSSAVMNIKKSSGGANADFDLLHAFAHLDQELIRQEIKIIDPQIIICCGTFIEFMWITNLPVTRGMANQGLPSIFQWGQRRVVKFVHPAMKKNVDTYHSLGDLVRDSKLLEFVDL